MDDGPQISLLVAGPTMIIAWLFQECDADGFQECDADGQQRQRRIHYIHSASLAYEDGIEFMSEPSAARQ